MKRAELPQGSLGRRKSDGRNKFLCVVLKVYEMRTRSEKLLVFLMDKGDGVFG